MRNCKFLPHPKSLPQGEGLESCSPSIAEGARGWVKSTKIRHCEIFANQNRGNLKFSCHIKRSEISHRLKRDTSHSLRMTKNRLPRLAFTNLAMTTQKSRHCEAHEQSECNEANQTKQRKDKK